MLFLSLTYFLCTSFLRAFILCWRNLILALCWAWSCLDLAHCTGLGVLAGLGALGITIGATLLLALAFACIYLLWLAIYLCLTAWFLRCYWRLRSAALRLSKAAFFAAALYLAYFALCIAYFFAFYQGQENLLLVWAWASLSMSAKEARSV